MSLRLFPYTFILTILLNVCCLLLTAGTLSFPVKQDSARQNLRLQAHLLIDADEINSMQLESLLIKKVPVVVQVSTKNLEKLQELVTRFPAEKPPVIVIANGENLFSKIDSRKIFVLTPKEIDRIRTSDSEADRRKQLSCKEFLLTEVDSDSIPDSGFFIRLWEQTGKMPNFIKVNPGLLSDCASLILALNNQKKVFGLVCNGDSLLPDVSWKDLPDRKTNGYFSFPLRQAKTLALSPYKAGYQFSPDIVLPTPENLKNPKFFNAVKLTADFGLTDHYIFRKKIQNLIRQNDNEIISYNTEFARDKSRGQCAFFSGKAYIDGGLKSRSALKPNFSITAWIKPTELGANNCILGKGKDFVWKIHGGKLTFTVQGVKDYFSVHTQIPLNQWSFVALVHTRADNCISFYLNGKLTEKISLLIPYIDSDYTMLIGSNLWEEYFVGYMSQIKIWDRELNEDEIRNEFRNEPDDKRRLAAVWVVAMIALIGGSAFLLRRRFFVKKTKKSEMKAVPNHAKPETTAPASGILDYHGQIYCFGGLKVVGADGKDISKKFSPKLKQLFVLILLHSVGGQKGISSKDLSDCLWPGMSQQNAKNIRGTNIQNLKALLASCIGIKLVFHEKLWMLEFADGYFIDYAFVEAWLNGPDTDEVEKLSTLLSILKKGTLFPNMSESWIDPYIDRMSNRIIEYGLSLFRQLPEEKYDTLLLEVAEVISINDPLNEPALRKKISILTRQGKLSLAHTVFDNFTKLYFELYQEKYPGDFKFLVANEESEDEIHPDLSLKNH